MKAVLRYLTAFAVARTMIEVTEIGNAAAPTTTESGDTLLECLIADFKLAFPSDSDSETVANGLTTLATRLQQTIPKLTPNMFLPFTDHCIA